MIGVLVMAIGFALIQLAWEGIKKGVKTIQNKSNKNN